MGSRREINRTMSRPVFKETLQEFFPELETLPHADTLNRLLERIDVTQLEMAHVKMIKRFIRNQKFRRYLITDVTQTASRSFIPEGNAFFEASRRAMFRNKNA